MVLGKRLWALSISQTMVAASQTGGAHVSLEPFSAGSGPWAKVQVTLLLLPLCSEKSTACPVGLCACLTTTHGRAARSLNSLLESRQEK